MDTITHRMHGLLPPHRPCPGRCRCSCQSLNPKQRRLLDPANTSHIPRADPLSPRRPDSAPRHARTAYPPPGKGSRPLDSRLKPILQDSAHLAQNPVVLDILLTHSPDLANL